MEFFGVEATIFMKFFRGRPIFFRGKTHIFKEVFKGECNLIIKSLEVRRQYKSSTGEGRGRGYRHQPNGTGDNNFVKRLERRKRPDRSSKVFPNIPIGPNRNGPFHLISNRNLRNFGLNGNRPSF